MKTCMQVVLDESKRIIHKWTATLEEMRQGAVLDAQMQKIVQLVRDQESVQSTIRSAGQINVLVVDDANTTALLVVRKLTALGHSAVAVQSGERALAMLRQYPNGFDLVFLDIIMPGMDGVEVKDQCLIFFHSLGRLTLDIDVVAYPLTTQLLRVMKSEPALGRIPVVMLSALEDETVSTWLLCCIDPW